MNRKFRWLVVVAVLGFAPARIAAQGSHEAIQKFFQHYFDTKLENEPEYATFVGRYENAGKWDDWSKIGLAKRRAQAEETLRELDKFPLQGLPDQDQLSSRLLRYDLRSELESADLENYLLRVGQLFGLHTRIYSVIDRMPARNVEDYERILSRLHGVPSYVDQNIALLNEAIARGLVQPPVVVDLVVKQLTAQAAQEQATTGLLVAFRKFPSNFPEEQKKKLRDEGVAAYEKEFVPSWKKLLAFMQTTYAPKARPAIGISSLPNGKEYYAILVRRLTTTNNSPEEIHKTGESELARIEAQMLAIVHETGFHGSVSEFEQKLQASPEQHFRSKEEMLAYCRNIAKIIEPELPNQFKRIPLLLYGVRAIPEDREQATATNAQAPAPDGSVPGWFNLNTYQPEKQARYDKEALVLHEAVPGHIFEGSLARAQQNLPEFRRFYGNSAYGEGWALYVEALGGELGLYRDPYSRFGQLASERFRAVRLVVDTGIHALGWSREQAIQFFHDHAPEVSLAEVDRYISWPAQALAYKTGQLKIVELRREAEQKLGPKFDVRAFHDAVLRGGRLPLELLQEQVRNYIASVE